MPETVSRDLRLGLIGCGVISAYYVRAIEKRTDVRITAVSDLDPARVPPSLVHDVPVMTNYADLMASGLVDAVIVNVPNDAHVEVCSAALNHDLHVCCEKPLALSEADAAHLTHQARTRGLVLFTAFHRRYNQHYIDFLDAGFDTASVSHVSLYYCEKIEDHCGRDRWYLNPDRCGGGCLADNGPNALDALMALLGPLTVDGVDLEVDDRGLDIRARVRLTAGAVSAEALLDWGYPDGELKGFVVRDKAGATTSIDYLRGYTGFKESLEHEYEGVLADFVARVTGAPRGAVSHCAPRGVGPEGDTVARLVADAYRQARPVPRIAVTGGLA
ncbi:Gfo/Idh/MocA family protein [Roseospira visakhapatnamensis]|uniref:Putative dehydrogenase n=1 Tax=Roseospira visakhapatnamensis TaxID=390880 RepID=A0A7W6W8A2_9PROT|nr:Gfo/Idh/MocA family oxidoreductase [Roseospira visakhapatnamensis]MBB4264588.1 putative dehydrogenase [Roseospira visakhapatnamensis]